MIIFQYLAMLLGNIQPTFVIMIFVLLIFVFLFLVLTTDAANECNYKHGSELSIVWHEI